MKHNSAGAIKAVSFDAAGTLFHAFPSVGYHYALEAGRFGVRVDPKIIESRFRNVFNACGGLATLGNQSSEQAEKSWWRETVLTVFRGFQIPEKFDEFFEALYVRFSTKEPWRLFPDVISTLEACKRAGKILAVLSNWDSRLFRVLSELGILPYFCVVVISAKAGATKPHAQIFDRLKMELRLKSYEILHVGDNYVCDIEGAGAAGFLAVHLDRKSVESQNRKENVIHSLYELTDFVL